MIKAEILADSKNEFGNRITTMKVTFPRIILAEFNTHRMFSRNSSSSRAIPFEKMLESVEENPFIPIAWQKDHKGMQGIEYFSTGNTDEMCNMADWIGAKELALKQAKLLSERGVTKQLCNRLLEPFMWHTVIVTATEWENFFHLRCPKYVLGGADNGEVVGGIFRSRKDYCKQLNKDNTPASSIDMYSEVEWLQINKGQAEIHMMALAEAMWDAYNESVPKELKAGEWHIPFGDNMDYEKIREVMGFIASAEHHDELLDLSMIKIATARCARVSYTTVGEEDKEPNYENDIKLHDRLAESGHWSPFEHCAKTMNQVEYTHNLKGKVYFRQDKKLNIYRETNSEGFSGNFRGFVQYRKTFQNENRTSR